MISPENQTTFFHSVDQALIAKKNLAKLWIGSDGKLLTQTWWRCVINWFTGSYDKQTARILTEFGKSMGSYGLHEKGDIGAFYHAFSGHVEKRQANAYKSMRAVFHSVFPSESDKEIQKNFEILRRRDITLEECETAFNNLLGQPVDAVVIDFKTGKTLLHYVIEQQKENEFKKILGDNLDAYMQKWKDVRDATGMTPFLIAAQQRNLAGIQFLEAYKVDKNVVDREENNFWHHVFIRTTNTDMASDFLKYMVEKNWNREQLMALNREGFSPFHLVFVNNNRSFVGSVMAPLTADDMFAAHQDDLIAIAQQKTTSGKTAVQLLVDRFKAQGSDPGADIHFLLFCLVARVPISRIEENYVKGLPVRLGMLVTHHETIKEMHKKALAEVQGVVDAMTYDEIDSYVPENEKPLLEEELPTAEEKELPIMDFIGKDITENWWRSFLSPDKVKTLLQKDENGLTPLHYAVAKKDVTFLQVIFDSARKDELVDWTIVEKLDPPIDDLMKINDNNDNTVLILDIIGQQLPNILVRRYSRNPEYASERYCHQIFTRQVHAGLLQAVRRKAISAPS